jgi:hypothetical protein
VTSPSRPCRSWAPAWVAACSEKPSSATASGAVMATPGRPRSGIGGRAQLGAGGRQAGHRGRGKLSQDRLTWGRASVAPAGILGSGFDDAQAHWAADDAHTRRLEHVGDVGGREPRKRGEDGRVLSYGHAYLDTGEVYYKNVLLTAAGSFFHVSLRDSASAMRSDSGCTQTIEVVAPSGTSCGAASFSGNSTSCTQVLTTVGYDGPP